MARYKIPENQYIGFKKFIELDDNNFEKFKSILSSIEIGESARDVFNKNIDVINLYDLEKIIIATFSLISIYNSADKNTQKFAEDFSESFREYSKTNEELLKLQERLMVILPLLDKAALTIKARDLIVHNKANFNEGRIASDIRIVYDGNYDKKSQYAIVLHQLRMKTFNEEGVEEVYISFSSQDLISLKEIVDKAIMKDKEIKRLYSDFTFIDIK